MIFNYCSSLTSVTIPDSVTSIGEAAFADCAKLTSVTIPHSVTSIGEGAFAGCTKLTSITIPSSVQSIGPEAFNGCSSLIDVYYEGTVAQWGNIQISEGNEPLSNAMRHYLLGSGTWGDNIIWTLDSDGLLSISGSGDVASFSGSSAEAWRQYKDNIVQVVIESGVGSIGSYAFSACSNLTGITIPQSVTGIGAHAFRGCSNLTEVTLPDNVTFIGMFAFEGCSNMTGIELGTGLTSIENYAFSGCSSLNSITIPEGVTRIGSSAFSGCSSLKSAGLIGSGSDYQFPWTTKIPAYAFQGCSGLTSVTIPETVTRIDSKAFKGCSGLTSILLPANLTSIGSGAFSECSGLTSITIPESVTSIDSEAFMDCSGLTEITLPETTSTIGDSAFYGCSSLTAITLPNNLRHIGSNAFTGCSSLMSISIPSGVTSIYSGTFFGCTCLTEITLPENMSAIEDSVFYECSSLTAIMLPKNLRYIRLDDFYGCTSLTEVTLPESVSTIENNAFYGCSSLTDVYYGGTEEQWGSIQIGSDNEALINAARHYSRYGIAVNDSENGSVAADKLMAAVDDTVTLTVVPATGYELAELTVMQGESEVTVTKVDDSTYTFVMPESNVTISVSFKIIVCTITWLNEDGSEIDTTTVEYGEVPTHEDPVKESTAEYSYSFAGWTPEIAVVTGDATYQATFTETKNSFTVSYDANGGEGAPEDQTKMYGEDLPLAMEVPTRASVQENAFTVTLDARDGSSAISRSAVRRTNYSFREWNTAADGSGESYQPGSSYTANVPVMLYAQWNSATETDTVILPTPTREGYRFKGWSTDAEAAEGLTGEFVPEEDTVLYAVWEEVTYTVTYDANGGAGAPESQTKIYGVDLALAVGIPSKEGCTFLGWATEMDADAAAYQPGDNFTGNQDTTLFAVWATPDLILPASLKIVEEEAFAGGAFTYVKLPNTTQEIHRRAFTDCPNLKYVYIPENTTRIDSSAFASAEGMTIIGAEGSYAEFYAQKYHFGFIEAK